MHIWKWLALAAMLYCSLAVWSAGSPPRMGPGPGRHGPDRQHQGGGPPPAYDFEQPAPPLHTQPKSSAEVVMESDSNHVLRWQYRLDRPLIYILAFPIRPQTDITRLNLRLKADFEGELRIGVGEHDGSMYFTPIIVTDEWQTHSLPLDKLELTRVDEDENGQLDIDQIGRVGIVDVHLGAATRKGQLVTVEIDDVSFD